MDTRNFYPKNEIKANALRFRHLNLRFRSERSSDLVKTVRGGAQNGWGVGEGRGSGRQSFGPNVHTVFGTVESEMQNKQNRFMIFYAFQIGVAMVKHVENQRIFVSKESCQSS